MMMMMTILMMKMIIVEILKIMMGIMIVSIIRQTKYQSHPIESVASARHPDR